MARRIPSGIKDIGELGRLVDSELQKLSVEAGKGFVSAVKPVDASRSYFIIDSGTLKFFNASDGTTKTVTIV
jgi:hypothetical protein